MSEAPRDILAACEGSPGEASAHEADASPRESARGFDVAGLRPADAARYEALLVARTRITASAAGTEAGEIRSFEDSDGSRFEYVLVGDDAVVVGCEPCSANVAVPSDLNGHRVRAIGSSAFLAMSSVERISLPDTVLDVGRQAFASCPSLRSVSFSRSMRSFDRTWLRGCPHLEEIALPGRLASINASDLDFPRLASLSIGAGMRDVVRLAFRRTTLSHIDIDPANPSLSTDGHAVFSDGGTRLVCIAVPVEHYVVPDGVRVIGEKAFAYDTVLSNVTLPEGLEEIGPLAFCESGLVRCTLPSTTRVIGEKAFFQCRAFESVALSDRLESIGPDAFSRTRLASIAIPASMRDIGHDIVLGTDVVCAGPAATFSIDPASPYYLFDGEGGVYARDGEGLVLALVLEGAVDYAVLPGTVAVAPFAAHRNDALRSVAMPKGVRSIGEGAFLSCSNLRAVDLPDTVEDIGAGAFRGTALSSIRLPRALGRLGELALCTCGTRRNDGPPTLRSVKVAPDSDRFYLDAGILCERVPGDGAHAVLYVGPNDVVAIPEDVTAIEPYAFARVDRVRELVLHDRIRTVGVHAFGFERAPGIIRFEFIGSSGPRHSVQLRMPVELRALPGLLRALRGPVFDPSEICGQIDATMLRYGTLFERAVSAIERLSAPTLLLPAYRRFYEDILDRRLLETCVAFAQRDFAQGFDALADLGYINGETISDVVDAVRDSGSVAMTGHVLELKRRRFGGARFDYEL